VRYDSRRPDIPPRGQPLMQFLFDLFPVIAFFVAYKLADIYVATGVLIAAALVQVTIQWVRHRRVSPMLLVSAVLVLIFGGLTLLIHDDEFIKWKPTILNWLFAAAFLGSQFLGEQPLVQRMLSSSLTLERPVWNRLNLMWSVFFAIMGAANLYVARTFDQNTWVNFKLFGMLGLTVLFVLIQGVWLSSKLPSEQEN
jgi:intracellular septation protein